MTYIEINSKKIFYDIKESGKEKALIFIHGSGGNSNSWSNQLKLEIDYDIIALDLPSHGKSSKFSELSLNLYVDILNELIISLNYKEVILCGHSLGGAVIQSYFFTHPSRVKALILVGTGGRLRVSPIILKSLANNYQEFLKALPSGAFYRKTSKEIIETYINESSTIGPDITFQDFSICDKFDMLEKTSSINIPCLIVVGGEDKMTPVKYSDYFHKKISINEYKIIQEAGHMVMLEKSDEFNKVIQDFIQKYF
ncbi:MAG: alpha/beta fold hydrolase [Promethearchaeota archaeon]